MIKWMGKKIFTILCIKTEGPRVLSLTGNPPHQRHCVVSLSKNINPSLVLVQPRKTPPFITERLLMGRKESNQTKTKQFYAENFCLSKPVDKQSRLRQAFTYVKIKMRPLGPLDCCEFMFIEWLNVYAFSTRPLDKSVLPKNNFLISQTKHMFLVCKRTISMRRFF